MTASLENRYRRLLVLFPRDHRLLYEEEMIGVLMGHHDGVETGQRERLIRTEDAGIDQDAGVGRLHQDGGMTEASDLHDPILHLRPNPRSTVAECPHG